MLRTAAAVAFGALCALVAVSPLPAADPPPTRPAADARRGAQVFRDQKCVTCHSVFGEGGKSAPDLGAAFSRGYTAPQMASLMWNHAPAMWTAMSAQGIARPNLTSQDTADLFAFFAAARYFDRPGEPSRGAQLFQSRKCAECHGANGPGKALSQWNSVRDPISLAAAMWNHAAQMKSAMAARKGGWISLSGQELSDLAHYVRSQPGMRQPTGEFLLTPPGGGSALFESKGCAGCHTGGKMALEGRLSAATLTDVAAAMWNHAPKMQRDTPTLTTEEMRELVGYIWAGPFFAGSGNAGRGQKIFAKRQCGTCHGTAGSGAPNLQGGHASALTMVSGLFSHGPAMLDRMRQKNVAWPRFERTDMADLIAYLNSSK